MRTKCLFLIALLLIPVFLPFIVIPAVKAISGQADVYILELNNVPADNNGVAINQTEVQIGAINACLPCGGQIDSNLPHVHPKTNDYPPYYQATAEVVTTWSEYEQIVLNSVGKIIVNTHGDYLPVPSDYNKTAWIDAIALAMSTRRLSWVHCGGYTFYKVYDQNGTDEGNWTETVNGAVLGAGFDQLMSHLQIQHANITTPAGAGDVNNVNDYVQLETSTEPALEWAGLDSQVSNCIENPLDTAQFINLVSLAFYKTWPSSYDNKTYLAGAVVPFAELNVRNATAQGAGAYVHQGLGGPCSDYYNGFIGTAAAVLRESWTFAGQTDAKQVNYGISILNATIGVQPTITGVEYSESNVSFDMVFPIYGVTQNDNVQFPGFSFDWEQGGIFIGDKLCIKSERQQLVRCLDAS